MAVFLAEIHTAARDLRIKQKKPFFVLINCAAPIKKSGSLGSSQQLWST